MDLSIRWLNDYVKCVMPPREYSEAMTMSGSKVEGYTEEGADIKNVVVGKVLSIDKHPDADKLVVLKVDVGESEPIQIVTGATNLFPGAVVPVALNGSTLPGGVKIKKGKLRGVESNGMCCSIGELNLTEHDFPGNDNSGIMILDDSLPVGQDIREALRLNDTVVEFEITPNRPDCLSVIGLARETAATFRLPITLPEPKVEKETGDISEYLSVSLESENCLRYAAKVVKNVKIAPSPLWLRERLRASGVRPINNIVDITNFVMLEYGQPMHSFDHRYVNGKKIVIRQAREGERITTLDDVERKLTPDMLVISDEKAPVAVAGVMGGEYSGIMDDTCTVVFESACFRGPSVRRTSRALGLRTESSGRYEKGLDPETCMPALLRACQLVEQLHAGEVVGGVIDCYPNPKQPTVIHMDYPWVNRFLGTDIPVEQMKEYLTLLDFRLDGDDVTVPSWRGDVTMKADVAEEIARLYGYDNIPSTLIRGTADGGLTDRQQYEQTLADTLLALGLYETQTYSFISPKYYDKIRLPQDSGLRQSVVISNPLGEDSSVMRTTAIPSMLEVVARNTAARNMEGAFYEMGKEYIPTTPDALPEENKQITIAVYGGDSDFFTIKGMVEELLVKAGVEDAEYTLESGNPTFHPGRCALVTTDGKPLGILGEIHPLVLENYGIGCRVYLAKFSVDSLYAARQPEKKYHPLPKFPATTRDLSLVMDKEQPVAVAEKVIRATAGGHLEKLSFFDIYTGAQVGEGEKSVSYSLSLRAGDRTLTDEEVDRTMRKILDALAEKNITLRA